MKKIFKLIRKLKNKKLKFINYNLVYIFIILIIITFFVIPNTVYAATCTVSEFNLLKDKADKIEFNLDYKLVEVNDDLSENELVALYEITAYNLVEDLRVYVQYGNNDDYVWELKYSDKGYNILKDFNSGKLKIMIKGKGICDGKTIKTDYLNLPYYNIFYDSDTCKNYPEFVYCRDKFVDEYINNVIFDRELEEYINRLDEEEDENNNNQNNNQSDYLESIIRILIVIVVFGGICYGLYKIITITHRRRNL